MKTKTLARIEKQRVSKLTLNELKQLNGGADLKKFADDLAYDNPPKK
jgi:hypothetical protein